MRYALMIKAKYKSLVIIAAIIILMLAGVGFFVLPPGVNAIIMDENNKPGIIKASPVNGPDAMLEKKIKDALFFHENVNVARTNISVYDGVVTLKGQADTQAQKELTEAYIDDVKGVKDVDNYMTVNAGSEKHAKSIYDIIDDASITSQIKTALLFHKSTSIFRTEVTTKDGVVTLSGKVKNAAEKDLIAQLSRDIVGVKKVVNNLTVE
jgi:hyperosmotically inducible protein